MFDLITAAMLARMHTMEEIDARDRNDGTPKAQRLRQVPPETGRFLAIMAASAPEGQILEIGTSGGYSTLWLALAGAVTNRKVKTFEISEYKAALAHETFRQAGVEHLVEVIVGDATQLLPAEKKVAFCFLDAEKEIYLDCYESVVPNMVPGGLITADNIINQRDELLAFLERGLQDARLDAVEVPIGKGIFLGRKV